MTEPILVEPLPAEPRAPDAASRGHSPLAPATRSLTIGLVLTVTLAAFEALAIATAMPVVERDLGYLSLYGWVFSAFMLGNLVGVVIAGILIDRRGLVAPYVFGLGLFAVGLTLGGLAPSMPILIAARALQGVGAGAIPATAYVAIGREYEPAVRPRVFAYLSTAWVVPGLVGPAIAGFVAEHVTWRAVFLGLLPLAVIALALTLPTLRQLPRFVADEPLADESAPFADPATETTDEENDRAGGHVAAGAGANQSPSSADPFRLLLAVRVAVGAGMVLAALETSIVVLAVALLAGGFFIALPALARLLPAGSLRAAPGMPVTVLLRGVLTFGFTGAEAYLPLMLVTLRGVSPTVAGLTLTAATITWAAGSWLQSHWYARVGARRILGIGYSIVALGIAVVAFDVVSSFSGPTHLVAGAGLVAAVAAWGIAGLGMGMCYPAQTLTVMELAAPREQGSAMAGLNLSDVVGTALGTGAASALVSFGTRSGWGDSTSLLVLYCLMTAVIAFGATLTGRVHRATATS